jgi:hypothetical protein
MVALPFNGSSIRLRQDRLNLVGLKVLGHLLDALLGRNPKDVRALRYSCGLALCDEIEEAAQCSEPTVARADRRLAIPFDVLQECRDL